MNLPAKLMFYSMLILTLVSLTNRFNEMPLYSAHEKPIYEELVVTQGASDVEAFRIAVYEYGGLNIKVKLKLFLEHTVLNSALSHLGGRVVLSIYSSNVTPAIVLPSFTNRRVFEENLRILGSHSKLIYQGSFNINFTLTVDNVFADYVVVIVGYELLDTPVFLSKYIPPVLVKTISYHEQVENLSLHRLVEHSTGDLNVAVLTKNYLISFLNNHVTYGLTTYRSIPKNTMGGKGLILGWILAVALILLEPYPFIRIPYISNTLLSTLKTTVYRLLRKKRGSNNVFQQQHKRP